MDFKAFAMLALFVAIFSLGEVSGRPNQNTAGWQDFYSRYETDEEHRRAADECENVAEVRDLCQRCAKVTKSRLAYPMCCAMRENTRTWCSKFLNIGLTSADNQLK